MNSKNLNFKIKEFENKQKIISCIVLLIFCGTAIIFNNLHLTSIAEESTRYLSRFISLGDQREVSLILHQAHLSNFKSIRYNSEIAANSFVIPSSTFLEDKNSPLRRLVYDSVEMPIISNVSNLKEDSITYEFNRFRLVPYAFLIWFIVLLVSVPQTRFLKRKLTEQFLKDIETEKKTSKAEMASQVRHNLRTPLAALMRIPQRLPINANNEKDLLQITIRQIQDLIGKLDFEEKAELTKNLDLHIYDSLLTAKQELLSVVPKHIDFKFEIEDMVSSNLVAHIPFELRSILSNMVNNSVEAIKEKGKIFLEVRDRVGEIHIQITDTGCGMPKEIEKRVFDKDFSYNKQSGSGIGLFHAKEFIEMWGGRIIVHSIEDAGTIFEITLPVKDKESWYLPRLKVSERSKIYVLDDQQSALELWKQKLGELDLLKQTYFFTNSTALLELPKRFDEDSIFLIDYDLSSEPDGLEVLSQISKVGIKCLVTGHFDNKSIQSSCISNGVYLLPKSLIQEFTIV